MTDDKNKKQKEIEDKEEEIKEEKKDEIEEKIESLENLLKRALADYQNLEKRVTEEKREWIKTANKGLILRLLPVLDTLTMANAHVVNEGLKLSIQQFLDVLKSEGVDKIEAVGKDFDPKTMDCVETIEGEEGKVLEEVRSGFTLCGQTLRAAMVKVGKGESK